MSDNMTPMQVFLHPGKASALLATLNDKLNEVCAKRDAVAGQLAENKEDNKKLKKEKSALQASLTETSLKLKRLNEEHEALKDKIGEIQAMVSEVEKMRQGYEQRIEKLRGKVADLQRELERERAASKGDIEPLPPMPKSAAKPTPSVGPKNSEPEPPQEWYLPLDI